MSVDLIRDIINYERMIGEGSSQTMVNGDILVDDRSPEIANVLNIDGRVIITNTEVVEEKVIVEGKIMFDILYEAQGESKGLYKMSASSNFNHNIQVPGALDKMMCTVNSSIEHMEYELMTNKKVKVNAVIDLKGMVYNKEKEEVITDIKGQDIQILKDVVQLDEFSAEGTAQNIIKGKISVPEGKSEIKQILKKEIHVHKKDVSVQEGKIVVNACALVRILYQLSEGDELIYTEEDVAFTNEIAVQNIMPDMKCDVSFRIEDVYDEIKENENGERKNIDVEIVVDTDAKAYTKRDVDNIVDAYSSEESYDFERENIKLIGYFGENTDVQNIKERITIPDDAEEIDTLKYVSVKPIITDTKMVEEKVVVEGVANCCVVYVSSGEAGGMKSFEEEIPFKSSVDMPGAKIDMIPEVSCEIEHSDYEKASAKEVDVKIIVESSAKVFYKYNTDLIKNVQETEIEENVKNMPSLTIYFVQPHDTLWKIAKKYYTTIDDILSLNEIENQDSIQPGMKLLIPKKSFMQQ